MRVKRSSVDLLCTYDCSDKKGSSNGLMFTIFEEFWENDDFEFCAGSIGSKS